MKTSHEALRAASTAARAYSTSTTRAQLALRVKDVCPDVSKAECRRAVDTVVDVRIKPPSRNSGRTPKEVTPLAERLEAFKRKRLIDAFEAAGFRHSRAWPDAGYYDLQYNVHYPDASQEIEEGWVDYKSRGYKRATVSETVHLMVPPDWGSRVRPLDDTTGILLLDAEHLPTWGPVEVYRATWCRQGRGVSLVVEHGHLARHLPTRISYHSTNRDPQVALNSLRRKVALQGNLAERAAHRVAQVEALITRLARRDLGDLESLVLTRADSLRAGNCPAGTDDFIERIGLAGRTSATLGEVIAAIDPDGVFAQRSALSALAVVVLAASRRDRKARRPVQA